MKFRSSRSTLLTLGLATLILGGTVVACSSDDAGDAAPASDAGTTGADATTTPPTGNDASFAADSGGNTDVDADTSDDAGDGPDADVETDADTDGGADDDAGEDPDAGGDPDASANDDGGVPAACNELKPTGSITSKCTSTLLAPSGGTIVAGSYTLESVAFLQKACGAFKPLDQSGRLVITKNKDGSFDADYVITQREQGNIAKPIVSRFHRTLDPKGATNGSPANVQEICPAGADTTLGYTSSTTKLATTLSFQAPYRNATALYTWTHTKVIITPKP